MAKLIAVDMLGRVTDKALQAHGGIGFWASSPIERVYRDARAQRFEEGTNEIQKTIIAREVFAPVHATIAERRASADGRRAGFAAGKVALITGSSRGIGRTLALSLADQGGSVVVNYKLNEDLAEEVVAGVEERGGRAIAVQADMESPEDIDRLFDAAQEEFGRLDYFVDNAAASSFKRSAT